MRWRVCAIALLMVLAAPASAETLAEATGINALLGWPPTAADVLAEMHQFDLFIGGAAGIADTRGTDALRKQSRAAVQRADAREQQIAELARQLGIELSNEPGLGRSNRLAGLRGEVGADFMSDYREKMSDEVESAQSVLQRYLAQPGKGNVEVKTFAEQQLSAIRTIRRASSN